MQNPVDCRSRPALTIPLLVRRVGVAFVSRPDESMSCDRRVPVAQVSRHCRLPVAYLSRLGRVSCPSLWGRRERPLISVNIVNRPPNGPDCTPI